MNQSREKFDDYLPEIPELVDEDDKTKTIIIDKQTIIKLIGLTLELIEAEFPPTLANIKVVSILLRAATYSVERIAEGVDSNE